MKYLKLTTLLLTLVIFACNEKTEKKVSETLEEQNQPNLAKQNQPSSTNDIAELEKLTKELYKWNETKSSQLDFDPLQKEKTDTIYARINLARHKQRLNELKETNLFADQFIQNYNKIALTIDEKMMNKTLAYYIGELPPYGNDANPWCNCQDNPDNYWEKITLKNVKIKDNNATYNWTWGDNFIYKVETIKENGIWKISYLQGFDFKNFIPTTQSN